MILEKRITSRIYSETTGYKLSTFTERTSCKISQDGRGAGIGATRLHVLVGVPVRVVDDDGVGGGEVEPEAARAGGQQEGEAVLAVVEVIYVIHALLVAHGPVDACDTVPSVLQVCIQQVHHACELHGKRHLPAGSHLKQE